MADPLSVPATHGEPPIRPQAGEKESTEGLVQGDRQEMQETEKSKEEVNETAIYLSNIAYEKMKDTERKS